MADIFDPTGVVKLLSDSVDEGAESNALDDAENDDIDGRALWDGINTSAIILSVNLMMFAEVDAFFEAIPLLEIGLEKIDAISFRKHPTHAIHDF